MCLTFSYDIYIGLLHLYGSMALIRDIYEKELSQTNPPEKKQCILKLNRVTHQQTKANSKCWVHKGDALGTQSDNRCCRWKATPPIVHEELRSADETHIN